MTSPRKEALIRGLFAQVRSLKKENSKLLNHVVEQEVKPVQYGYAIKFPPKSQGSLPIHVSTTTWYARSAREDIARVWCREDETLEEAWRRLYRKGYRCVRVAIMEA